MLSNMPITNIINI